jgi:hypothetical protein
VNNRLTILVFEQTDEAGRRSGHRACSPGRQESEKRGDCWSVTDGAILRRSEPARVDVREEEADIGRPPRDACGELALAYASRSTTRFHTVFVVVAGRSGSSGQYRT